MHSPVLRLFQQKYTSQMEVCAGMMAGVTMQLGVQAAHDPLLPPYELILRPLS